MKKIILTVWALLLTVSVSIGDLITVGGSNADNGCRSDGTMKGASDKFHGVGNYTGVANIFTAWVIPFQLPDIGSKTISVASLQAYVEANTLPVTSTVSLDLLGVRVSASSTVLWSDYQGTVVGDNLYSATKSAVPLGSVAFSSAGLATYLQSIYNADANAAGKYVFLAITPDAAVATYNNARFTSANGDTVANRPVLSITTIPEPATIGMLGLGVLITLLIRRMHR